MKRFVFTFVLACVVLAVGAASAVPALAADGQPLFASPAPVAGMDQLYPAVCGSTLVFEASPSVPPGNDDSRIYAYDFSTSTGWWVAPGAYPSPVPGGQFHPAVLLDNDVVTVVYEQKTTATTTTDLSIWRGDRNGSAQAGFPKALATGPAGTHRTLPAIGLVGGHVVVAWQDDQNGVAQIHALDLTDTDVASVLYDPATAAATPLDADAAAQTNPTVGPKGVFWLDSRTDDVDGYLTSVWRCDVAATPAPVSSAFYTPTGSSQDTDRPVASTTGAGFLGPGFAGGPFEPFAEPVGGKAKAFAVLAAPSDLASLWETSGARTRYAIVAGHGGATDGDSDVFFYDTRTQQTVPACSYGSTDFNLRAVDSQWWPTIGSGKWGVSTAVFWADARANDPATPENQLFHTLYFAAAPDISLTATHATIALGSTFRFTTMVEGADFTVTARLQKGARYTDPAFRFVRYKGWSTLASKKLAPISHPAGAADAGNTGFRWKPAKKGTFYLRVWFVGTTLDGISWIPNSSNVLKVVVK